MPRWKTTLLLLLAAIGIGTYISLYEIRQPSPEEREQHAKEIVNIRAESVTRLVLDMPQAKVTLTREGTLWKLAPQGARADPELIERLLEALSPLVAERILSGPRGHSLNPKAYGLEPAVGSLSLVSQGSALTLFIGETTPVQDNRYLKVSGRPEIFVISSSLFDTANVPAETFRDPLLIRFNSWLVTTVRVASSTANFTLTRHEPDWQLTRPLTDRAERSEVDALLSSVAGIRIKRVVTEAPTVEQLPQWGFETPKAEITLQQTESPTSVTLFFGKAVSDDTSLIYAKRSDEAALYAVASADVEPLLKDPNSLRATGCFEFVTSNVTKVEVMREATHWTIERKEAQWREQASRAALETKRVGAVLDQLADLRVKGFVEDSPSDLTRYGLAPAVGTIAVWATGQDTPQRLLIGSTVEGTQDRYGRIEGRSAIVRLPDRINELLATTIDQLRPPS